MFMLCVHEYLVTFLLIDKGEIIQMCTNRLMNKQNIIYPYNGTIFAHEKEQSTNTQYNLNKQWKQYSKSKKPVTKDNNYDSIHMSI